MKTLKIAVLFFMAALIVSCGKKEEQKAETQVPAEPEVYQPKSQKIVVSLETAETYAYFDTPKAEAAEAVDVFYGETEYSQPTTIRYSYANGDELVYEIPQEFGLWKNQNRRFRVVSDADQTVWVQGQTKQGKFHEFVFYGDPKNNGKKIKPNSYRNLPNGEIVYR